MSKSYDIDAELLEQAASFRAIAARVNGVFDDPFLLHIGALDADPMKDVQRLVTENLFFPDPTEVDALMGQGFVIGLREPKYGGAQTGKFMVMENAGEVHPEDEWCIVGDNLRTLVSEAWSFWADHYGWSD